MAKSKKRRATTGRRRDGSPPGRTPQPERSGGARRARPSLEGPLPAAPIRPRRSPALRALAGFLITIFVLGAFYGIEVVLHRTSGEERRLLSQAPSSASAAGCTTIQDVRPYPRGLDRTHIGGANLRAMPPLSTYPSTPPASGPHSPVPLGAGVYATPPPIDQAIHSLEHAAVIVWLDPAAAHDGELARVRTFFARSDERNHVIVAPYEYPFGGTAGMLPAGRQLALVAWHRLQYCDRPSLAVAYAFVHRFRFDLWQPMAYRGVAPEKLSPI